MEVEAKLKIENPEEVKKRLIEMGVVFSEKEQHHDSYFIRKGEEKSTRKPGDFLLRIRDTGNKRFLTFKGLTDQVGAWEEYEVEINDPEEMKKILRRIGFTTLFIITKEREPGTLDGFEVNLDNVEGLGHFIEVALESEDKKDARKRIIDFVNKLGFRENEIEHRGYAAILSQSMGVKFEGTG